MNAHSKERRRRRPHSRVFTACDNCKKRHLKCDERKPSCRRCEEADIVCTGYHPPRAWIFEMPRPRNESKESTQLVRKQTADIEHPYRPTPSSDYASTPGELTEGTTHPNDTNQDFLGLSSGEILNIDSLGIFWKRILIDIFLTSWMPRSMALIPTPMTLWPQISCKLAIETTDALVEDSVLSLALCLISSQTQNPSLVGEVSRYYSRTLQRFQTRLRSIQSSAESPEREAVITSLIAAGFCCAQVEFILQSKLGFRRHFRGIATFLRIYGPSCLKSDDICQLWLDHRFLWTTCAIVFRKTDVESQSPCFQLDWSGAKASLKPLHDLLVLAEQIPFILRQYDETNMDGSSSTMCDTFQKLKSIIGAIQAIKQPNCSPRWHVVSSSFDKPYNALGLNDDNQENPSHAILMGYCMSFGAHAALAMWDIFRWVQTYSAEKLISLDISEEEIIAMCDQFARKICFSVDGLLVPHSGMVIAVPVLFFVDAACLVFKTMSQHLDVDVKNVREWSVRALDYIKMLGFCPVREVWASK